MSNTKSRNLFLRYAYLNEHVLGTIINHYNSVHIQRKNSVLDD